MPQLGFRFSLLRAMGLVAILGIVLGTAAGLFKCRSTMAPPLRSTVALPLLYYDADTAKQFREGVSDVSMIQLIALPEKYQNKPVRVAGLFHFKFEGTALYLTPADADFGNAQNSLSVDIDETKFQSHGVNPKDFDEKYVSIEGVFDVEEKGHGSICPGGIRDIWLIRERRKLADDEDAIITDEEFDAFRPKAAPKVGK